MKIDTIVCKNELIKISKLKNLVLQIKKIEEEIINIGFDFKLYVKK